MGASAQQSAGVDQLECGSNKIGVLAGTGMGPGVAGIRAGECEQEQWPERGVVT